MPGQPLRAVVGFDGFVDHLSQAVKARHSSKPSDFASFESLSALAERLASNPGDSTNLELRPITTKAGGNGPLTSSALSALGVETTCIGAVARSDQSLEVDPLFETEPRPSRTFIPIAAPGRTDAIEFKQGKLMLNHPAPLDRVTWDRIVKRVGIERLRDLIGNADVLATVNWTNVPTLPEIWRGLATQVLPSLHRAPPIVVDISDPARRSDQDLVQLMADLRALNNHAPVSLGLNLSEACRFLAISGAGEQLTSTAEPALFAERAAALRKSLGLSEIIIHTSVAAALATESGADAVTTRQVETKMVSTGAGDHFTGGYTYALAAGRSPVERLKIACETATAYVEHGKSASLSLVQAAL